MRLKHCAIAVVLTTMTALGTALTSATAAQATPGRHAGTSAQGPSRPAAPTVEASGPGVFPHSVDHDPDSRKFVVGSPAHSTISSVGQDGTVRTLVDDKDLVSVQAVRVDSKRNRILATNVDYGLADRSAPATRFQVAGVASCDAGSGRRLWYADLNKIAGDGKQHLVSDVTIAPDGTAYAVDELTPTIFRIDRDGRASVLLRVDLLAGKLAIPGFLNDVGMSAVAWMPGNILIVAMADGSLVRVPVHHPEQAAKVRLSTGLKTITAGIRVLPDGSVAGATTTEGTSISAMSAALWQFVRVRHGTRRGPHGMDVFDRGRGGRDGAEHRHANAHVPPPRSTRDGIGTPASAAPRSTAGGGTNA
ncbi:hypothetical protein HRW07_15885 [Streptomyces lunaelactis]|uniref:hypothetical protein n=1 Tax=Streptomyces lunaelactis TaxID=1535768 RepID=UPI001584EA76|nr:hypothetical protein [Streptomyces lunaelactis]NUL04681.1 hypothetical protein [Streptomyces lunaelactis]